jgi:hypothetical protein
MVLFSFRTPGVRLAHSGRQRRLQGDGAGRRAWERCTRQSADLAATTAGRCPPAASNVRTRRWTGARPSQRRRRARSARCSRGRSPAPGTFGPARLCVSCPESDACGGRSHPPSGQPRRPVERVANIGWQFSSPGQPSYPGLSRQTDSTGILEDRAGRTSVTSRSPRRRGDDRPHLVTRTPCRRPAAAGKGRERSTAGSGTSPSTSPACSWPQRAVLAFASGYFLRGRVALVPVRWRHIPPPQDAWHSLGAGAASSACWTG